MTDAEKNASALLATAASHLIKAGELTHQMRALHRDGLQLRYCRMAERVAADLAIANHCFAQVHAMLMSGADVPATTPRMGGLVN
jgi:hypothetical protein